MPLIIGAKSATATGYTVDNSCRFNDDDSSQLQVTNGTATDNQKWTCSFWIKRGAVGGSHCLMAAKTGSPYFRLYIDSNNKINFYGNDKDDSNSVSYITNRLFRDPSAWYHIVTAMDSTLAAAGDRFRIYVNGVEETSFSTETDPTQNKIYPMTYTGFAVNVASRDDDVDPYDGYMAEVCLIDGQQLTPSSFGEFDEDSPTIWKPIAVSGLTFGNNGFYLDFQNSADLGADVSGNSNDLTVTNLDATDQATDTPTNNFCTLNPLDNNLVISAATSTITLSQGNCKFTGSGYPTVHSTQAVTKGKWYWEVKVPTSLGSIIGVSAGFPDETAFGAGVYDWGMYSDGNIWNSDSDSSYGNALSDDDILGIALDVDNSAMYVAINNTWQDSGDPTSGASKTGAVAITAVGSTLLGVYHFVVGDYSGAQTPIMEANFGGCPAFAISSGNADADGYGNFEYAPPSGFFALCTKNLAEYG